MFLVTIDADTCVGCGECTQACPAQILKMEGEKAEVVGDDCMGCQSCVAICEVGAITVEEY
ncbi:MAG: 4Fe-4S dicluster domain-containing protein [Veillonellaceae bacterium]|jgi:NAD-dependent dihydropyrimidine dehydrogenase PreA subunit|nr:4Fe-4S dicluster domain-containing protein [Veillonellaceae bacterium]